MLLLSISCSRSSSWYAIGNGFGGLQLLATTAIVPRLTTAVLAVTLLAGFASDALANTITISGNDDYRDTLVNERFVGQFGFQTFCIEFNEEITLPGAYAAAIGKMLRFGGVAGGIGHDSNAARRTTYLISFAAYLYSQFAGHKLSGYTHSKDIARAGSALRLQERFWHLDDEVLLTPNQEHESLIMLPITDVSVSATPVPDVSLTATMLGFALSALALLRRKSP